MPSSMVSPFDSFIFRYSVKICKGSTKFLRGSSGIVGGAPESVASATTVQVSLWFQHTKIFFLNEEQQ